LDGCPWEFFRSPSYTAEKINQKGRDTASATDPAEFGTLGSGAASRSPPAWRELIREKLPTKRGKIATRYKMWSNQLRLYFSSIAYVLMQMLRRTALAGTQLEKAQCGTIRRKLLKILPNASSTEPELTRYTQPFCRLSATTHVWGFWMRNSG